MAQKTPADVIIVGVGIACAGVAVAVVVAQSSTRAAWIALAAIGAVAQAVLLVGIVAMGVEIGSRAAAKEQGRITSRRRASDIP